MATQCGANIQEVAALMQRYLADQGGVYPSCDQYPGVLKEYLDDQFPRCPVDDCCYGYNVGLAGLSADMVSEPQKTIVFFEVEGLWPNCSSLDALATAPKHQGCDWYATADGAVHKWPRRRSSVYNTGWPIWLREPEGDWVMWEPKRWWGDEGASGEAR